MNVAPSSTYEAVVDWGSTGATIGMRVLDNAGATAVARVTGFTELPAGSGIYYRGNNTAPATTGQYTLVYDDDGGTAAIGHVAIEDLLVTYTLTSATAAANEYVTVSEVKNTLSITSSTYDTDLAICVNTASREIDAFCGRRFWSDSGSTVVRYYTPTDWRRLQIDDLQTLTTLAVDQDGDGTYEETWTNNTDFVLEPMNAPTETPARPWESLVVRANSTRTLPAGVERSVKLTGKFGWAAVPDEIQTAASILAVRLFKRTREAHFGVAAFGGDQSTAIRIARTDPDVANLLAGYVRHTPFL